MRIIKGFLFCLSLFAMQTLTAQLQPIGPGMVSPLAGPVNPPLDYNAIKFDYDIAGNQIKRYMVTLSPGEGKHLNSTEDSTAIKAGLIKDAEHINISYYPNPVRTELYLKWTNIDGQDLKEIYLFDLNGARINYFPNLSIIDQLIIDFVRYPSGIYTLQLVYNTGDNKVLKIVKQ